MITLKKMKDASKAPFISYSSNYHYTHDTSHHHKLSPATKSRQAQIQLTLKFHTIP
ncbi:hypothetical protein [Flavobacterium suncheonense]|uniref:hypothetical protein n=1 Tax=Flavobacterium suncheonense TaxID=350894 RepID=UPI00041CCFAD|nr:hypothetical protein [Flavobacterium suncheonense]